MVHRIHWVEGRWPERAHAACRIHGVEGLWWERLHMLPRVQRAEGGLIWLGSMGEVTPMAWEHGRGD